MTQEIKIDTNRALKDLTELVSFPSLAFDGYDPQPNEACGERVRDLFAEVGFDNAELISVGPGFPAVWAQHHASDEAPTVLLYGHYDVQPAPVEAQHWESDPWTLTRREDGRYYGRGAADDKSGIVQHLAALRAIGGVKTLDGLNVKVCIEGEEEAFGHLEEYVQKDPERFKADLYVIADTGNTVVGTPVNTTSLRGDIQLDVRLTTLSGAVHSGIFGGPAPDALVALTRLLGTLWDDEGNTAIEGIKGGEWQGADFPEELFKSQSGMLPGKEFDGSGSLATRLWARPNATIIAVEAPRVEEVSNILIPTALARVAVRIPAGNDPQEALEALKEHFRAHAPATAELSFGREVASPPFQAAPSAAYDTLLFEVLEEAFGVSASTVGCGASIPLLSELQKVSPEATFALFGPEDLALARIHGGNESVDLKEIETCALAEALLFKKMN